MFADEMDILSLSQWRATCHANYSHAVASLQRTLTTRIQPFVPYPHNLVSVVTKHGAVFGGEVALSFMLRPEPYHAATLEIFASNFQFEALCTDILDNPHVRPYINNHSFLPSTLFTQLRRHVTESVIVHLTNGFTLYIHRSYTCSPSDPITRSACTALSNFVSGYGFGCSHPALTLSQRALLADQELAYLLPHDALTMNRLLTNKFTLAVSPTAWPEYRRHMDGDTLRSAEECWRNRYVCPKQVVLQGPVRSRSLR